MVDAVHIQIDGSLHEGGGQIIRTGMALSNILQKSIQLGNIRINRPNPGLNNQLIAALKLMKEITKAEVAGDKQKSLKITYEPQMKIKSGNYTGGAQSAAAISLMVQSIIPTMIFGKDVSTLKLQGGSDVNKSPPFETIQRILRPLLKNMGVNFEYNLISEGYYPRGGGQIQMQVTPIADYIKPITITKRSIVKKIYLQFILTDTCKKPQKEFFRPLKKDITNFLISNQEGVKEEDIEFDVEVKTIKNKKYKECYSIVAHAYGEEGDNNYFAFTFYNDEDLEVEDAAQKVYEHFVNELSEGGCLDEYHQDQLLIYMALANGVSSIRVNPEITAHTKAGFYVLQQFFPELKIEVIDEEINHKKSKIIKIQGVGLKNE